MKNMKKVVFIASAPRSGSTLLELILSSHSKCFGIGEAYLLFDPYKCRINEINKELCGCGNYIDKCEFWKNKIEVIRFNRKRSLKNCYEIILSDKTTLENIVIDSSKLVRALKVLISIDNINLKIIHLVKDVRSFIVSQQDSYRRRELSLKKVLKRAYISGAFRYLMKTRIFNAHYWYLKNLEIMHFVKKYRVPSIIVRYEDLCILPQKTLKNICRFLNLEFEEEMLDIRNAKSHNVFGNRMRFQKEKRTEILYDYRWFYKNEWLMPYVLFPYISALDRYFYLKSQKDVFEK